MNITEVTILSDNLRQFYDKPEYPILHSQTGDLRWGLIDNKILSFYNSYTPRDLSEWLLDFLKETLMQ